VARRVRATRQEVGLEERRKFMASDRKKIEDGTKALEELLPKRLAEIEASA
jgi:hypothetical protein